MPRSSSSTKTPKGKEPSWQPIISSWVHFLILIAIHAWVIFVGLNPATDLFSLNTYQRASLLPAYYLCVLLFLSIFSVEWARDILSLLKSRAAKVNLFILLIILPADAFGFRLLGLDWIREFYYTQYVQHLFFTFYYGLLVYGIPLIVFLMFMLKSAGDSLLIKNPILRKIIFGAIIASILLVFVYVVYYLFAQQFLGFSMQTIGLAILITVAYLGYLLLPRKQLNRKLTKKPHKFSR